MDDLQKTNKEYKNFKEAGDLRYIYQNDKACFEYGMA